MSDAWQQFISLDPSAQAAIIGVLVSVVVAVAKKLSPTFAAGPAEIKFLTASVLAAIGGYLAGSWPGAVLAVLVALGTYDGAKNFQRGAVDPLVGGE